MALLENCNIGNPYVVRNLSLYEDILIGDYPKADDNLGFSKELRRLKNDHEYYQKATLLAKQMADKYSRENVYLLWRDYYRRIYLKYHPNDKIDFD
jgi:1,2-diacylglycerol-3-alpha-glucose alpha-1,2-galactosyltransferase